MGVQELESIGVAPPEDGMTTVVLPDTDRRTLEGLAANSNVDEVVRRIDVIFECAAELFDSSGTAKWVNNTQDSDPSDIERQRMTQGLPPALHLAARGLGWLKGASQLLPSARPQLAEALERAEPLFYQIGWLTFGCDLIGISGRFEFAAESIGRNRGEIRSALQ